jgi:hypothetical protein
LPLVPGTQLGIYEIVSLIGSGWMREVFNSTRSGGVLNLFLRPADGSGEAERLATSDAIQIANSCSPDSRMLMYQDGSPSTGRDIWVWSSADRKSSPWLRTPYDEAARCSLGRSMARVCFERRRVGERVGAPVSRSRRNAASLQ